MAPGDATTREVRQLVGIRPQVGLISRRWLIKAKEMGHRAASFVCQSKADSSLIEELVPTDNPDQNNGDCIGFSVLSTLHFNTPDIRDWMRVQVGYSNTNCLNWHGWSVKSPLKADYSSRAIVTAAGRARP